MRFLIKAIDAANQPIALELEAPAEASAREIARRRGLSILSMQQRGFALRTRNSGFPTTLFSTELVALLEAGLNIVEALQTLQEKEPHGENRAVLSQLIDALHRGESFSQAASRFPAAFPPLYAAILRSSERTGNLREALSRYIAYREALDKVRNKLAAALLYPAILAAVGGLVFGFLMFYVVPRFARVYEQMSSDLPFFSGLLLATGGWTERNSFVIASLLLGSAVAGVLLVTKERARGTVSERLWRISPLGARLRIHQLARFYRTAGMLLRAGIPAVQTFGMVAAVLPPGMRVQLARATALLQEGERISVALTSAGLTTPVATRLLAVGEQSGRMGELMDRIARFYDDETARFVDAFARVFEPLLMAVLGIAVGAVVLLMYMPIFELAGALQ